MPRPTTFVLSVLLAVPAIVVAVALVRMLPPPMPVQPGGTAGTEAIVAKYIRDHPEEIVKSVSAYMDARKAAQQQTDDAKVEALSAELADTAGLPVLGNREGSVTIAYFFDDNCPFCKHMSPILDDIVANNPDVKIIHRVIPILGDRIGSSRTAAVAGLAVFDRWPGKYKAFHDAMLPFKEGQMSDSDVGALLKKVLGDAEGVEAMRLATEDPTASEYRREIEGNLDLVSRLGVHGTPFIYVKDGAIFRGATDEPSLQAAVDKARAAAR
jgi:protein-disulfide isomerase